MGRCSARLRIYCIAEADNSAYGSDELTFEASLFSCHFLLNDLMINTESDVAASVCRYFVCVATQ